MFAVPSLDEFYSATLKSNGFVPPADEIAKVAAAQNIDVETAKIARAIFEQLQLDGVPYESNAAMLADSIKMAGAYLGLIEESKAEAQKLAAELHKVAKLALENFLTHNRIELDSNEAVKIAGLQAQSFQELASTKLDIEKAAALPAGVYGNLGANAPQTPANLNIDAAHEHIAAAHGADPVAYKNLVSRTVDPANVHGYYHAALQDLKNSSGNLPEFHERLVSGAAAAGGASAAGGVAAAAKPGLMSRPGLLLGAGALGLGALHLMRKKKQERESAAMNRANAIGNVAGLPEA
jgi:hypothetical protein